MQIIEPNKDQLNNFVLENNGSFLQSWQWGELQSRMNRPVARYLFFENGQPRLAGSFVRHDLPMGKYYWLCPKGLVLNMEYGIWNMEMIKDIAEKLGGIFIRVEPEVLNSTFNIRHSIFQRAPKDHNPRATILVDLGKSEEELLTQMHPKTRYNLKLAQKKGVKISDFRLQIADFLELMEKTAQKGKFHLHPRKYYEELSSMEEVKLFGAYYQGRLIAAAQVSFWGDKAVYLHGASDYEARNFMAPYLLHWEIIRQARSAGLKYYDFGGVSPKDEPHSPLSGISRFKQGFGGEYVEYVGSWDYVLSPFWYTIYKLARRII